MKQYIYILLVSLLICSCTDPYKLQTNTFEEALVIEATITNEFKQQEIKITKTYKFEDDGPEAVTGADVIVSDEAGNSYHFEETDPGIYVSSEEFQAAPNLNYHLNIVTADGSSYSSANEKLTAVSAISGVTATEEIVNGLRGVSVKVNSFDPTGQSKYYRFQYEETYKIIAPYWAPFTVSVEPDDQIGYSIDDVIVFNPRTYEAEICYSSAFSNTIMLANTNDQTEDRIQDYPVRFIDYQDKILRNRYSINVKQYVQSLAAYTFYKTLSEISGNGGSILSQNQPGFFSGNLRSDDNPDEKVIGFFEVSSVSQSRIFFNYHELFPSEPLPDYFYECEVFSYDQALFDPMNPQGRDLRSNIVAGTLLYYTHDGNLFYMVKPKCGDCTKFSSNVRPSYWVD